MPCSRAINPRLSVDLSEERSGENAEDAGPIGRRAQARPVGLQAIAGLLPEPANIGDLCC